MAINIFTAENREGRIDVARAVGSAATAMYIYELPPGASACPYHYEYEEEWLLVVDGTVVLRTPHGERTLERGELVCFPPGPAGAHKVSNRSGATDPSARATAPRSRSTSRSARAAGRCTRTSRTSRGCAASRSARECPSKSDAGSNKP